MASFNQTSQDAKGKGKNKRRKKHSTQIDMTPMVDLAFLLLTFFMLTTTFSRPQKMPLTMPDEPKTDSERPLINEKRVLTIVLGSNDEIFWYIGITDPIVKRTDYSKDGIRSILLRQNTDIEDLVVLIKPMDDSNFQNLVDILDEMNITNMERYSLMEFTDEDRSYIRKIASL